MTDHALPTSGDSLWPDHVAHSVTDLDRAYERLEQLGFALTPRSKQLAPDADGKLAETGMANHCIMLRRGYLEISGALFDGSAAVAGFRQQIQRHVGLHLIAFGSPDPLAQVERLNRVGFSPASSMNYQRMVETETGEELARFTLATSPRDLMPEARMIMVRHETPDLLWQKRWLDHANGALALEDVVLAVQGPEDSAARLERFTGVRSERMGAGRSLALARGRLDLLPGQAARRDFPRVPPLPAIAGYVLRVADASATAAFLSERCGKDEIAAGRGWARVEGGDVIGGVIWFAEENARLPWRA